MVRFGVCLIVYTVCTERSLITICHIVPDACYKTKPGSVLHELQMFYKIEALYN